MYVCNVNLLAEFCSFREKQLLTDVNLVCCDGVVMAHKLILATASSLFQKIILEDDSWTMEEDSITVLLPDIHKEEIDVALSLLYGTTLLIERTQVNSINDILRELHYILQLPTLEITSTIPALPVTDSRHLSLPAEPKNASLIPEEIFTLCLNQGAVPNITDSMVSDLHKNSDILPGLPLPSQVTLHRPNSSATSHAYLTNQQNNSNISISNEPLLNMVLNPVINLPNDPSFNLSFEPVIKTSQDLPINLPDDNSLQSHEPVLIAESLYVSRDIEDVVKSEEMVHLPLAVDVEKFSALQKVSDTESFSDIHPQLLHEEPTLKEPNLLNQPIKCNICKNIFNNSVELVHHQEKHTCKQNAYKCSLCTQCFEKRIDLEDHEKNHVECRLLHCSDCKKAFKHAPSLIRHRKITHEKILPLRKYQCDYCKKCFTTNQKLHIHLSIHTGLRKFDCKICTKRFYKKSNLVDHLRTHTNEKPYRCNVCQKSFRTKSNRNFHLKIHQKNNSEVKNIEPPSSKITGDSVLQLLDKKKKILNCNQCTKTFSTTFNLKRHEKSHIKSAFNYYCNSCHLEFQSDDVYRLHICRKQ